MTESGPRARYRAMLERRRDELNDVRETSAVAAGTVELDQTRVGRLSRMDAIQVQAMSVETNRRREIEIQRIAAALARLDNDEFGFCLSCGEAISDARLDVDPSTPVCIDCAVAVEQK